MSSPVIHLCFHGIGRPQRELEPGEAPYWVSTDVFHAVLDTVVDDPRVRISFDDGNASDAAIALPALLERGLTGTFFVLAGRLDQRGSLSSDDVRELSARGMVVGSHGMDHVPWRGLDDEASRRELVEARDVIGEVTGQALLEAALPLGRYDRRTLGRLRRLGYTAVHSSDRAWSTDGAWLQPRFSVRDGDDAASVRREMLTRARLGARAGSRAVRAVKRLR